MNSLQPGAPASGRPVSPGAAVGGRLVSPPPGQLLPRSRGALGVALLVALGLGGLLLGLLVGAFVFREDLARQVLRRGLNRLTRTGLQLSVGRIEPHGLSGVTLQGVHLRPGRSAAPSAGSVPAAGSAAAAPSPAQGSVIGLDIEAVDLRWSTTALWAGQLELTSLELVAPKLHVDLRQGVGPVVRELQSLQQAFAGRGSTPSVTSPAEGEGAGRTASRLVRGLARLPMLRISGGELALVGTGYGVDQASLTMSRVPTEQTEEVEIALQGTLRPTGLHGGPCTVAGTLGSGAASGAIQLDCSEPITLSRRGVSLTAGSVRLELGEVASLVPEADRQQRKLLPSFSSPGERVSLFIPAIEVVAPVPGDATPRPRLSGALRILLGEGAAVGVEANLRTPPAGQVLVLGHLQPQHKQAALDLRVDGLDLAKSPLPALLPGVLESGTLDLDVTVDLVEGGRRADVIGRAQLSQLQYFHPRLAREPVRFSTLQADVDLAIDLPARRVESAASRLLVNQVPLIVDGELDLGRGAPLVRLEVKTGPLSGAALAASIPRALIPRLSPQGVSGQVSFGAFLLLDLAKPEELKLEINNDLSQLRVDSLGPTVRMGDLTRPFVHTWQDQERRELYRLETGPGSASWTSLSEVPDILRIAILAQEDGGFMWHRGFSLLHVKGSLIRNLQTGRFARGASTISMQLARNLFLGREKLLARKLQEVILTWRLEQQLSKEAIFELYLNIIEWGHGVFGIRAAAEHYFGKKPHQLTLAESLFLSTSIPRPRAVDRDFRAGRVSRYHTSTIQWMLQLMRQRGHITEQDVATAQAETLPLRDPATAPALANLWDTVPHGGSRSHQVTPSYPEEDEEGGEGEPLELPLIPPTPMPDAPTLAPGPAGISPGAPPG